MKEQSTGRGFAYLSLAEFLVKLMSLIYMPLLIRVLGDVGHGVYAISYDAFTMIYVLTNEGIQRGIAKLISELHAKENPRDAVRAFRLARTILIAMGLFASVLLYALAPRIAGAANTVQATLSIRALAPTVLITSILAAYRGYFLGRSFVSSNAISKVLEQLINAVVSLSAAYLLINVSLEYGVAGGTLGTSVGALAAAGLLYREYRKFRLYKVKRRDQDKSARHHSNGELVKKLFSYSFPITLSAGMMSIGGFIDMFIVNTRLAVAGLSNDAASAAYSQLIRFKTLLYVPNTFMVSLSTVLLPAITRLYVLKEPEQLKEKIGFAIRMALTITVPAAVGMAVLSEPIYGILFESSESHVLLRYGAVTIVFLGLINIQNVIFQGLGKFYWGVTTMGLGILSKLLVNYVLVGIPEINIMGAVLATFMNFFLPFVLNHYLITKVLRYEVKLLPAVVKPLLSGGLMGVFVYLMNLLFQLLAPGKVVLAALLVLTILLGALVYFLVLFALGGVQRGDVDEISPRLGRKLFGLLRLR